MLGRIGILVGLLSGCSASADPATAVDPPRGTGTPTIGQLFAGPAAPADCRCQDRSRPNLSQMSLGCVCGGPCTETVRSFALSSCAFEGAGLDVLRTEGCGKVSLELVGYLSYQQEVFDAESGALLGVRYSTDYSDACGNDALVAGEELDCPGAGSCLLCGTGELRPYPRCP